MLTNDMAVTASQIARWLRIQRENRGMSQGDAAKVSGLSADAISKWERGEKGIMAENFVALAIAYDADARSVSKLPEAVGRERAPALPQSAIRRVAEPRPSDEKKRRTR